MSYDRNNRQISVMLGEFVVSFGKRVTAFILDFQEFTADFRKANAAEGNVKNQTCRSVARTQMRNKLTSECHLKAPKTKSQQQFAEQTKCEEDGDHRKDDFQY